MKRLGNPLISLSAPLLILLAITGFLHREGRDKIQAIPALVVGSGLVVTGAVRRFRRRRMLFLEIKKDMNDQNL
ncbi:DUF3188 domain-containing protein [Prochlorococcus marinus]|uniref:DUF3188 domain-containing protein n=1 Tax=Prochlorococcus marinus TaxID=1219 RepID=UPI0022B37719|nr:DUF3188 domain-containing protein [Prochlorococcus marinus]